MSEKGNKKLDQALEGLQRETPDRISRAIRWLRNIDEAGNEKSQPKNQLNKDAAFRNFLWLPPIAAIRTRPRMKSSWWYCGLVLLLFCAVSVYAEGFEPTDNEDIRSLRR